MLPDEHAQLLTSHQQLQSEVNALSGRLQEWQQTVEQRQAAEAVERAAVEERAAETERRHNELLATLQSTLQELLAQHQQSTQQQAEQSAAAQRSWQGALEQHTAITSAALTAHRDELTVALAAHKQELTSALSAQHDSHTSALASLESTTSQQASSIAEQASTIAQHSGSIAQLLPLDEEVGSIRSALEVYSDDISGLVERGEATGAAVEALKLESERLLSLASEASGRWKRVESEVVEVKRAGVEQSAEWKAAWQKVDGRIDEMSERIKDWTGGWADERKAQQTELQQLVSGQHEQDQQLAALRLDVQQLRHFTQRQRHDMTLAAPKQVEEHKDGEPADESSVEQPETEAGELTSSSHFTEHALLDTSSASRDGNNLTTASDFLPLSPTGRATSTSLSFSSDSLRPTATPVRSHSISLPASPSDLSSVFPSVSAERQAGVFTSPAKVVQATQAMAWTINVKDGKAAGTAAVSSPPPRHSVASSSNATNAISPRPSVSTNVHRHSTSASMSGAGKGAGAISGRSSVVGSGRSSVSGSMVSSPTGKVSRQLTSELDESGPGSGAGTGQPSVAVTAAAEEPQADAIAAVHDYDDETY